MCNKNIKHTRGRRVEIIYDNVEWINEGLAFGLFPVFFLLPQQIEKEKSNFHQYLTFIRCANKFIYDNLEGIEKNFLISSDFKGRQKLFCQLISNNITSHTKQSRCTWMKGRRRRRGKHWRVLSLRTKKWERNLHLKSASRTNASSSTHNLSVSECVRERISFTRCTYTRFGGAAVRIFREERRIPWWKLV